MGLIPGNIKFNYQGFAASYILIKVRRYYVQFFDAMSDKDLIFLINNNKSMLNIIGAEKLQGLKIQARTFKPLIEQVPLDMLYGWIPAAKKSIIEQQPNGKQWIMEQLAEIKKFLLS